MGFFYSINTLGALTGTILAGFILIQIAGISYSNIIMALINITVGVIAIIFSFNIFDKNEKFSEIKVFDSPIPGIKKSNGSNMIVPLEVIIESACPILSNSETENWLIILKSYVGEYSNSNVYCK